MTEIGTLLFDPNELLKLGQFILVAASSGVILLTVFALITSLIMQEYKKCPFDVMFKQWTVSVTTMILSSPFTGTLHFLLFNGYIGKMYKSVDEFGWLYLLFTVAVYLMVEETMFYWIHRICHIPLLYKYTHSIHHYYKPVTSFMITASQSWDLVLHGFGNASTLLVLPFHFDTYFYLTIFSMIWGAYVHDTVEHTLPGEIFIDNKDHLLHHKTSRYNYGLYTRFWDKVCNTYCDPRSSTTIINKLD